MVKNKEKIKIEICNKRDKYEPYIIMFFGVGLLIMLIIALFKIFIIKVDMDIWTDVIGCIVFLSAGIGLIYAGFYQLKNKYPKTIIKCDSFKVIKNE